MTSSSQTAVLLLDLQNDLVHPDGKMAASGLPAIVAERRVLQNARGVADRARAVSIPVVYVGLAYREDYADVLSVAPRLARVKDVNIAVRGTWGSEFHSEVAPQDGELVFHKQCVNPFFNTPLFALLARWSVHQLVLCGVATNLVVESAARFADDAGFAVTVLGDCCASPNPAWHDFAVQNILPLFGRVATSEQLLAECGPPRLRRGAYERRRDCDRATRKGPYERQIQGHGPAFRARRADRNRPAVHRPAGQAERHHHGDARGHRAPFPRGLTR